ncbi:MAG: hypothetical protein Q4A61_03430 [Porphyromonadaceae bacterium]|nr:hypothetical protein [Porphyromonadaceae bacterium]
MKIICSTLAGLSILWSVYCMFVSWGFGARQLIFSSFFPLMCYLFYTVQRDYYRWREQRARHQRFLEELRHKETAEAERARANRPTERERYDRYSA